LARIVGNPLRLTNLSCHFSFGGDGVRADVSQRLGREAQDAEDSERVAASARRHALTLVQRR
jgi:hypothetical protein